MTTNNTATKERPILFSAEMVRAILDGRKTQTRRVVKAPILISHDHYNWKVSCEDLMFRFKPTAPGVAGWFDLKCPYGQPGDRLWVRETWRTREGLDHISPSKIQDAANEAGYTAGRFCPIQFIADLSAEKWADNDSSQFGAWGKTRQSRFMPRWASRIDLAITNVRVERVQDISDADAIRDGIFIGLSSDTHDFPERSVYASPNCDNEYERPRYAFNALWDSINGKREGCSWAVNPWVWVIEFERIKP